jgi:type IX secretion system PorP/SprF family membrane protein
MINLQGISRQQYAGLEGNPKTSIFGADMAFSPMGLDGGIGIQFYSDQIGFTEELAANLNGAIKVSLDKATLAFGVQIGFRNQVLDPKWHYANENEGATYHEPSDGALVAGKVTGNAFDMGIGAYYSGNGYYSGVSVLHLLNTRPRFDGNYFYYFKRTLYLTAGKRYEMIDKPIEFRPSLFVKTDGVSFQTDLNCNVFYKKRYWGGMSYRLQDGVILLGGLEMKSGLKVGFSYDIPTSAIAKGTDGGLEVSLGYTFEMSIDRKVKKYKSVRYL